MKNHFWIVFLAGLAGVFGVMAMLSFARMVKLEKMLQAGAAPVARVAACTAGKPVRETRRGKPEISQTADGGGTNQTVASQVPLVAPVGLTNQLYLGDVRVNQAGAVIVRFDSQSPLVLPENMGGMVRVDPAIGTFRITANTSGNVKLVGAFEPNHFYTITFLPGWKNEAGGCFTREQKISVRVPNRPAALDFISNGPYYPLHAAKLELPYTAQNVTNLAVQIFRAYENNVNAYEFMDGEAWDRMAEVASRTLTLHDAPNCSLAHQLDVGALLTNRVAGVYYIRMWANGRGNRENGFEYSSVSDRAIMILTDLGVQAVRDEKNGKWFIGVNRLSDGRAVAGAEFAVLSHANQILAKGQTGPDGSARVSNLQSGNDVKDPPNGVTVRTGDDFVYMKFEYNLGHTFASNWRDQPRTPRAFVFMERGVCRPGETFTASAFVRTVPDEAAGWRPLAGAPFTLTLLDGYGKKLAARPVTADAAGFVSAEFTVSKDAPTGLYSVEAGLGDKPWGEGEIRIAAFTPDRIRVTLHEKGSAQRTRDKLYFALGAKYYFGSDVPEATYTFRVSAALATTYPKAWALDDTWVVGDPEAFKVGRAFQDRGALKRSAAEMTYPGFTSCADTASFSPVKLLAEASVQEPGGRSVTANVTTRVYPSDWLVGLHHEENASADHETVLMRLLPVEKTFRMPEETLLKCAIAKVEWNPHFEAGDRGKYTRVWRRELVPMAGLDHTEVIPAGTRAAAWERAWNIPALEMPGGCYEVLVSAGTEVRTRFTFWRSAGEAGERAADPAKLTFMQEAVAYEPGQVAKLRVRVAKDGLGYVVAGERGMEASKVIGLTAGENVIEVPIPGTVLGSRYFAGVTVIGAGPARNEKRAFGLAEIKIDQKDHKLDVRVDAPEVAKPGEKVTLTASVAGNREGQGRVRFMLVDEGVLALTRYATPDLFGYFYGDAFKNPFSFYDLYDAIYPELTIKPNGQIGGDGALPPFQNGMVSQKPTVRLVLAPVPMDEAGQARVTITVPDHLGALRVMALASADAAVGSGECEMQVRDAVSLTLAAPRYAVAGDRMEVTATLFNHDCTNDSHYAFTLAPPARVIQGPSIVQDGKLNQGRSTVLWFPYAASEKETGAEVFTGTLTMGGAQAKAEAFITVRPAVLPMTKVAYRLLKPGEVFDSRALNAGWIGSYTGSCTVAASPAVTLRGAIDWLNGYPYGCLEQTVSGAFPFLSLPSLVKLGVIGADEAREVRGRRIEIACSRVVGMMHENGSFSMWPKQEAEWAEGSVYAAHFLVEAEKRGFFTMGLAQRQKMLTYLAELANSGFYPRILRAYAAYVLGLAGDERFLNPARAISARNGKDPAGFFAAAALIAGGYAAEGMSPMVEALRAKVWEQPDANLLLYGTEASRLGSTLSIVEGLNLREAPVDTAALAMKLNSLLKDDNHAWGTTHANAWATLGLSAYAAAHQAGTAGADDLVGVSRPLVGGTKAYLFPCGHLQKFPVSGKNPLVISNASANAVFLATCATGLPSEPPAEGGPIALTREYEDGDGHAVSEAKLGDLLTVRLTLKSLVAVKNLVVADILPAGFEIEDGSLATRSQEADGDMQTTGLAGVRFEKRDDRCLVFGNLGEEKEATIHYRVRAVCRGEFKLPEVTAEDMYDPTRYGRTHGKGLFRVR